MKTDDVDLQIRRHRAGWTSACLWVNNVSHEFMLTHLFEDPLKPLVRTALDLSPQANRVAFDWQDEPGSFRWTFSRVADQHNLFTAQVETFATIARTSREAPIESTVFVVEYRLWKALVWAELTKVAKLLEFSAYSTKRNRESFPYLELRELEQQLRPPGRTNPPTSGWL